MKCIKASGTCVKCGRYSEALGTDNIDAEILLHFHHGCEYGHTFDGEMKYTDAETPKKEVYDARRDPSPRRR